MGYVFLLIAVILFLFLYARWFERSNIFFPTKGMEETPSSIGLGYEDIYFDTADGKRLNGWFIPADNARGTVLFCHGNAGNISHRMDMIRMINGLKLNVFIFDYRGYGKSIGFPTEKGTYIDAKAAYDYLLSRTDVDKERMIIFGKSLGGAIAIDLATKVNAAVVISDSAFTSTINVGKEIYPFLPMELLLTMKYDSLSKVKGISEPILIIHSSEDEIIPFDHGQQIFEASGEPKEFFRMRGGHNEGFIGYEKEYTEAIDYFLKKHGI